VDPAKTELKNGPVVHAQMSLIESTSNRSLCMFGAVSQMHPRTARTLVNAQEGGSVFNLVKGGPLRESRRAKACVSADTEERQRAI
jgi:hypothetical protein